MKINAKKSPHVMWVCSNSDLFFRSEGEVRSRPGSVIPKLVESGIRISVLIPYDPTLLPKTKLSASRIHKTSVTLSQNYPIEIIKLTRGNLSPAIFMTKSPILESPLQEVLLCKSAIKLIQWIGKPVDLIQSFGWEGGLLSYFIQQEDSSTLFKNTKTLLIVPSVKQQGNFPHTMLSFLGIERELFHPEGFEFFGRVSLLKAGFLISDMVILIDSVLSGSKNKTKHGFEGIIERASFKLKKWASARSVKNHFEAYSELLQLPCSRKALLKMKDKIHSQPVQIDKLIEMWGPLLPIRYGVNTLSFLVQSPEKAYVFWEWSGFEYSVFGLRLIDKTEEVQIVLGQGLSDLGDFWFDVSPAHEYIVELLGWDSSGKINVLLRSRLVRIPRNSESPYTEAVFINVRDKSRKLKKGSHRWEKYSYSLGASEKNVLFEIAHESSSSIVRK
ncbi:MAG: glycogen/starch synthase [Elusimicrobiota bacterium]